MTRIAIIFLLLSALAGQALALMPPRVYAERSEKARIKAIAVIVEVVTDEAAGSSVATFRSEYRLTPDAPNIFTGTCRSSRTEAEKGMVGPTVYFHPAKGDRVFVTVSEDGGSITSLTPMTPELEKAVRETPGKIRYGISKAYVGE